MVRIAGFEPAHLAALPPQSKFSNNPTLNDSPINKGDFKSREAKNDPVLTAVLTRTKKRSSKKRFQRAGKGLFRFKRTGIYYGVFKCAGKTRWKNLGTDDLIFARQLLADEQKRSVKVDWKQAGIVSVEKLIERYQCNPMNLAPSTLKIRKHLLRVFQKTWTFGLGIKARDVKSFMLRSWLAERRSDQNLKAAGVNNYIRNCRF
jgi:uncharacterized protein YlaI